METSIQVLDTVALTRPFSEQKLARGQVGTVVEELGRGVVLVEFADNEGRAYALAPIPIDQLLVLHYQLAEAV